MRRSIGLFDVVCIGLNAIVGSGIFALPDDLQREMGNLSPLAFLLCAIGLLPVALCYSEAAGSIDTTGGPYVYARDAFGPTTGFAVGWMCFANSIFSFAAVACIAAAYLVKIIPALDHPVAIKAVAVGVTGGFALLNYRGARVGALTVDVFTVAKFAVLLVLIAALLVAGAAHEPVDLSLPRGLPGVGTAVFIALFAAQGFEVAPVTAGETRSPRRSVPIAVVSSLIAASLLYVVVQWVLVASFPGLAADSETPLADAALGVAPALGWVIAVGGLVSTLGFVSGSALGTPRYLYAAADDRQLPQRFATVHPRFESPHQAIVATALLVVAFVIPFDYRALIGMSNVAVAVQYLATCLAVLRLRQLGVHSEFRIPGGPLVPLLGAGVSAWVFTVASGEELVWAGASLATGLVLRLYSVRARTAAQAAAPAAGEPPPS